MLALPHGNLAARMWNCDETGMSTAVASKTVLVRKGSNNVHQTASGSGRDNITVVLCCGSAAGERLTPFVLYKGVYLYEAWTRGGPDGCHYAMSTSGWMESSVFHQWFLTLFLPAVSHYLASGPVVLFLDGQGSHTVLPLIEEALKYGVIIYCLPPHCTHVLQLLDVSVFSPLKTAWRNILQEFRLCTLASALDKIAFPSLLKELWERAVLPPLNHSTQQMLHLHQ